MITPNKALEAFGFSTYEARAYAALLAEGEANGYALAKAAGIPRASIYAVADKLVARGAAARAERPDTTVYIATPPEQLLRSIESRHQQDLKTARAYLESIAHTAQTYSTAELEDGEALARARLLIDASRQTLTIGLQPTEAGRLSDALSAAHARNVAVTTLCLADCHPECGGCVGDLYRCQLAPGEKLRWLMLISDNQTALLAQMDGPSTAAIVSDHPLLIELSESYIRQSAALALIGDDPAGPLKDLLSATTQQQLRRLGASGHFIAQLHRFTTGTSARDGPAN